MVLKLMTVEAMLGEPGEGMFSFLAERVTIPGTYSGA